MPAPLAYMSEKRLALRGKRRGYEEARDPKLTERLRTPNTSGSGEAVKTLNTTQGVRKKKSIAPSRCIVRPVSMMTIADSPGPAWNNRHKISSAPSATPNYRLIGSRTFGDDRPSLSLNGKSLFQETGGKPGGFRSRIRSLTVMKAAHALKLRHPTNRKNFTAVLPPYPTSLTHGGDRSIRPEEQSTTYTRPQGSGAFQVHGVSSWQISLPLGRGPFAPIKTCRSHPSRS